MRKGVAGIHAAPGMTQERAARAASMPWIPAFAGMTERAGTTEVAGTTPGAYCTVAASNFIPDVRHSGNPPRNQLTFL